MSESELAGMVTTDSVKIADWINAGKGRDKISVIFGTYQSGHTIADAIKQTASEISVLIADEAHRTAGIRRRKKRGRITELDLEREKKIRDFTLCHDHASFPATYRVYQTATPRIYDTGTSRKVESDEWIVRNMDDESTFGVELYRMSYVTAVQNHWLADYRIIALGVNDKDAYLAANNLAQNTLSGGRSMLTTTDYLRGMALALAMGGSTLNQQNESVDVEIRSCIAFMNTVDKSKNMAKDLNSAGVRDWISSFSEENLSPPPPPPFFI